MKTREKPFPLTLRTGDRLHRQSVSLTSTCEDHRELCARQRSTKRHPPGPAARLSRAFNTHRALVVMGVCRISRFLLDIASTSMTTMARSGPGYEWAPAHSWSSYEDDQEWTGKEVL